MTATPDPKAGDPWQIIADLRRELDARSAERDESLAREAALAEVLQVINSSPGYLAPVFEAMLEKATRLCNAAFGILWTCHGDRFRGAAFHNVPAAFAGIASELQAVHPQTGLGLVLAGENIVVNVDIASEDLYRSGDPLRQALADLGGARSKIDVALRKDDVLLGDITIFRQQMRPFSEKEISLLQNFADQAVIAIENARLITETREALDQQTATAEVLRVISGSATDVQPVFEAITARAAKLCEAEFSAVARFEDGLLRLVATNNLSPDEASAFHSLFPRSPHRGFVMGRAFVEGRTVHVEDVLADPDYDPRTREVLQSLTGYRTFLGVPILRDGNPVGVIGCARRAVRPFTAAQIELVTTFANQAVIAIENARLFNDLRQRTDDLQESLEYQTATSDVLKVISRATSDVQPVLDTVIETAARLCNADIGTIQIREGEVYRAVSSSSSTADPEYWAIVRQRTIVPGRQSVTGRVALEGRVVHVVDIRADPDFALPEVVASGRRTQLGVPLLRKGTVLGTINLGRQRVEPFTERQIELVRTFADQAVIAIENARLLTELRESLERQQAIAEVLQVINSSPGDLAPVFDVMLEKAMRLCKAAVGFMTTYDGERFTPAAMQDVPKALEGYFTKGMDQPRPGEAHWRLLQGEELVHNLDQKDEDAYRAGSPLRRAVVDLGGTRTALVVALRKDRVLLGTMTLYRKEVRPFTDKQISLLRNFAAQAVIAMDNARLLDEIRQRQAELHVTFENMGDGVAMFDSELRLAAWNRNFQQILDLPDELVAKRPSLADYVRYLANHGEYGRVDVEAEVRRLTDTVGSQWSAERTRPDGRVIEVRHNPVPSGGFVLIYSDITQRKRAEAEIHAAREAAEKALAELKTAQASLIQAEKMGSLGQLTAGIAHEIKNPLNFVNNFAGLSVELLDELKQTAASAIAGLADDDRADVDEIVAMLTGNLEKIAEHGRRADGIVKSMLEHSRGESGDRRNIDLNALVDEALNLAYHGARAQDQKFNITLERDFADAITPIELAPQDMTRVFLNLFANGFYAATKRHRDGAAPDFRPMLRVATRNLSDAVEIRIRDNGTGIPPDIRDKLFQPFFTTKPTGEGTGLGLSISYDIVVQQHGGTISVDSQIGEFTEFVIHLPRTRIAPSSP